MSEPNTLEARIEAAAEAMDVVEVDEFGEEVVADGDQAQESPPEVEGVEDVVPEGDDDAAPVDDPETGEEDEHQDDDDSDTEGQDDEGEKDEEPLDLVAEKAKLDSKWAAVRRLETRLKRAEQQLEYRQKEVAQKEAEFKQQMEQKFSDPKEVIEEYCRITGQSPIDLYKEWTVNGINFENRQSKQLTPEQIKEQAKREIREELERERQQQQQQAMSQAQQIAKEHARAALNIPLDENHARTWPNLAVLEDVELEPLVEQAVLWSIQNRPNANFQEVLTELDKNLGDAYAKREARRQALMGHSPTQRAAGTGSAKQAGEQGQSSPKGRTSLGAGAAGGGTSSGPDLSTTQGRYSAASKALPDFSFDTF